MIDIWIIDGLDD